MVYSQKSRCATRVYAKPIKTTIKSCLKLLPAHSYKKTNALVGSVNIGKVKVKA